MAKKKKKNKSNKKIIDKKVNKKGKLKICPLCQRPHKARTNLCTSCNKKSLNLKNKIPNLKYKPSIERLLWLKKKYRVNDVFTILDKNPILYYDNSTKNERAFNKWVIKEKYKSNSYRETNFKKWEGEIPEYIFNEFKKHKDKAIITISGDKMNPNIHYLCKKCGKEQVQKFKDINSQKGHNCESVKSSGEIIVEEFLKGLVDIKTQFDTFKCINPITGRQLPYDIEIVGKKILIEVQGEQHLKFIEYFHGSIDNFEYQKRKDSYKKRFAEKYGYKILYIYYDEIDKGTYKQKIMNEMKLV